MARSRKLCKRCMITVLMGLVLLALDTHYNHKAVTTGDQTSPGEVKGQHLDMGYDVVINDPGNYAFKVQSVLSDTHAVKLDTSVDETEKGDHMDDMNAAPQQKHNELEDIPLRTITSLETTKGLEEPTSLAEIPTTKSPVRKPYLQAIASVAKDNVVILAIVDSGFLDMVINLIVSSIKPLGINNFVILATDDAACPQLATYGITCVMYKNLNFSQDASIYGSKDFNSKMSIRSEIMIEILSEGFTVLHTDTDLYFYSNPLDHINCPKETCHMAALYDYILYNAGFVLFHPNDYSINVYKGMMELQKEKPNMKEQQRFNAIIKRMQKRSLRFKIVKLPEEKFQCGKFFDRHFFIDTARPCPECVVVHNNWIRGMHEKILRAKEMHQWMYDKNGYYSSITSKYLTYENPEAVNQSEPGFNQLKKLGRALEIGYLLNRTVILPKFHLKGKQRPLLHIASISALDKVFGEAYREHSFLLHPLVPEAVKQSTRGPVNIVDNLQRGIEESWILQQFKDEAASVLHFGTLDRDVIFTSASLAGEMKQKMMEGLKIDMDKDGSE